MKITAGLGAIDNYIDLCRAGADEVFCGFVPYEWNKRYGSLFPLNRREVLYYNIQINSYEDMKILKKLMDKYKVPVTITFNYLYYLDEQYSFIGHIIKTLMSIGFYNFTIADPALILYLRRNHIDCNIHLSGECAEINSLSMEFFNQFNIKRYIFHRKNTFEDMKSCINNNLKNGYNLEYEAFILNEKCHFTGAYCNSLHCDELIHLCKMPYELKPLEDKSLKLPIDPDSLLDEDYIYEDEYKVGTSGCGLCSLKKLKNAGVTHLKVVGRGSSLENMVKDIETLKKALELLSDEKYVENFEANIKEELFKNKCSKDCYYL